MSQYEVLTDPEFDDTQEVEDIEDEREGGEEDDGSEEDDDILGAAALPRAAVGGKPSKGLGRKKRGGKKKTDAVNQFKADDEGEVEYWTDGLNSVLKGLEQCASAYFPDVLGSEHKEERKESLKKFHAVSVDVVGCRMKLEQAPVVVQKVYDKMDLERAVKEVEDDEEFCAMLDEFGERSNEEIEKLGERVNYNDAIQYDEKYTECLELLNKYQKIKGRKIKGEVAVDEEVDVPVDFGPPGVSVQSQGLEALTEYIPTHDPVTRRVISSAVVNRKCGHVYDDKSIREFLFEVGGFAKKCPYAGCTGTVTEADLKVDAGMRRKVMQRIREEGIE